MKILKYFLLSQRKEKNATLSVLPFHEISIRPELFIPPRFRIQVGYPERDGGGQMEDGNCRV